MKKALFISAMLSIAFFGFRSPEPPPVNDFCTQLNKMLDAAKEGFEPVKGAATTRVITGKEKNFFISNVKFVNGRECYINDVQSYPECECILETDTRITEKLSGSYDAYKKQIKECLGDEWVITEKDSTNDFYLKDTKYKKLVVKNKTERKLKFHLYIYSSMIEKKRVVELKFEGVGKK